jgi:hypothetical protein
LIQKARAVWSALFLFLTFSGTRLKALAGLWELIYSSGFLVTQKI